MKRLVLTLQCLAVQAYQGVSNVQLEDHNDTFGLVTGRISWTLPENMTNVKSFKPYFAVDWESPSGNDDVTHTYGMAAGALSNTRLEVDAPATQFLVGTVGPDYTFQRRPPWPWVGPWGASPAFYSGDRPLMVLKVLTRIGNDYQTNSQLRPESMLVVNDVGWQGDPPLSVSFVMEEGATASGITVSFLDRDLRCGSLGGAINISVPDAVDVSMLMSWKVELADDLQGTNKLSLGTAAVSRLSSVSFPADFQHGSRVALRVSGVVNSSYEVPMSAFLRDDCGGPPNVAFTISFTDEEPQTGVISGTVLAHVPMDAADEYSSMNFYLATRASNQPTWIGSIEPPQTQFTITGVQLNSRDLLYVFLNNSYGQSVEPQVIRIQEMISQVPSSESQVLSIQFNDEDGLFGQIRGRVTWTSGSLAVTEYFAIFAAQDSAGKGKVQVSPNVSADAAHEWYINANLDTSGEPYTYLLVYAGNSLGLADSASYIQFEDSRVTCTNDAFQPCPKSQVLKELLPYACQGERCSAQECCTDAGTCSEFLNGTNSTASAACAEGYVPLQSPPEFCAGPQCQSSDCCLRTAESMAEVQTMQSTWDSIQVSWSVPNLNNCTFQEYQVQLLSENSTTWQDATGCSNLKDSCGSSCLAQQLRPSVSTFRARARVKCLLIGAEVEEFFSPWTESAQPVVTGMQPPNAPALMPPAVRYATEVLQSWNPLDSQNLGPDCVFASWSVQIREVGTSVWNSVTTCGSSSECLIQNLKCNTDYEVRVAALCQAADLIGDWSTSTFRTTTGEQCLRPALSPTALNVTDVQNASVTLTWDAGSAMECTFDSWLVQYRISDAATWHTQGCWSESRDDTSCTVESLRSLTTYEIRISEVCNVTSTNSEWSDIIMATTLGLPAATSGLSVQVMSFDTMQLSWSLPTLNDCVFSRYHLQASVVGSSAWDDVFCEASSVCDTSCLVSSLPSNTALSFRVRTICGNDQVLNSDWSAGSLPLATWPRPTEPMPAPSNLVLNHERVALTWQRPNVNDCTLQGYQVELFDGSWRADPTGCTALGESSTGCTLTNLACDTAFQARIVTLCSDPMASSTGDASSFRTMAGAECLRAAMMPRGLLLISGSVGKLSFTWEAGEPNDCTFVSWDVHLNVSDGGQAASSCQSSARNLTSCSFSNLAENTTYVATVQEICSQPLLSSPLAQSLPATTLSVALPVVVLQLPFPNEPVRNRPTELTVMYDVDVELPPGGPAAQVCATSPCSGCSQDVAPSIRNFRLASWAQNSSFWQQGCSYSVTLPVGFVVTRQQPSKSSASHSWSFTFQTPAAQIVQVAQVLNINTENATVSIAWDASVEFRCRIGALETAWQLAPREVASSVEFSGLLPETRYDIECMARLQDEPSVVSSWLWAGQIQTEKDFNVDLAELYLHVQPLCSSHSMASYDLPVTPNLQPNRSNYSVALPNADFALNCTQQEATWQLELKTRSQSQYATTLVTAGDGSANASTLLLTLPANEVLVSSSFTVQVDAGCRCAVDFYYVQVMGLRLSFGVAEPTVIKATGDPVALDQSEEGHRLQVLVSYDSDALPASLWNSLSIYVGPFPQATLAAPHAQSDASNQVYVLMTTLSAVGKNLPLQIRLAGALVGESAVNLSFAEPFVNCISTTGYGQCSTDDLEKREVFVGTLGETMLYVKGQGFGNHESLPGSDLMRISVTQSFNATELCEASGFVSNTEMWCRLVPKGASPLEMLLLGPMDSSELLRVPWSIRYQAPLISNFSEPILRIVDGGQLYIIGQNFPDFQDDGGTVGFEANGSSRRLARELAGISTSEVCISLTRVNQTHLLCDMKSRIDLTPARCTDVDIVVAWGDLTTQMNTVPLRLPSPDIFSVTDGTPNRPRAEEVGSFLYHITGLGFGTMENGRIQVLVGNRSCEVSSREDTEILCQMTGPLRDDLTLRYPEVPVKPDGGNVEVVVPMPVWITLGSSSIESSEDCKPIAANWSSHEVYLKTCAAGSRRDSTETALCSQCEPGWYTPVSGPFLQCVSCPQMTYSHSYGSTACQDCPAGRSTQQNATPSALDCHCLPGRYVPLTQRLTELDLWRARRGDINHSGTDDQGLASCESCPVGASCAGGLAPPVSDPGWWLLDNEVPVQCMMQGCLGNNTCRRGYDTRTRCETCMDQFYPDLQESTCNECESWVMMFGAIYGALTFVVLFGLVFPFLSWKARVALDPARGVAPPKLCFGLFHCCLKRYAARRQLVAAEYVDMSLYHDKVWKFTRRALAHFKCVYHSPMRRLTQGADLQPVVNIIFNNLQVFFLIANIGYYTWPDSVKEALNFGLLMVMSAESLRPSCVAPIGSEGRWYLIFAAPFALYVTCFLFIYFRHRHNRRRWRILLMVSGGFLLYLSPFSLLSASMIFDCVRSGDNDFVWDADRGIVCWSDPAWFRMAAVGIGGLFLLFLVLIFVAVSAYRTYIWYNTAEVGMIPGKEVFFTWWWLSGLRGLSLKHRAAIQGYKVHLDLPKDVTEASEVSSLCDDLLLQNVANLKSGIERLNDYLQGFRVDDAKDSLGRRPWRGQEPFCEHCQGCGKHMHNHKHKAPVSRFCGLCQPTASGTSGLMKIRSRLRKAAYSRLMGRLEHLSMQLRQMSSFSDRNQSLKDLLSFAWELITLVYKTSLGMTRLLSTQYHRLGLQVALLLSICYLVLSLMVWPYRHNGLNILAAFFGSLSVICIYSMSQLQGYGADELFWTVNAMIVALITLVTMVLIPISWAFYALWNAAFSENYYVMATQEVQGTLWRGPSSPKSAVCENPLAVKEKTDAQGKKAYASMLTRVVSSPDELLPDEPVAAQWCFRLPLDVCRRGEHSARDGRVVQHLDLTLEQGIGITVRAPAMLLQILNAEGGDVDFQGQWGLPQLPPCRLRRGGDLPGRLRISVPCSDQRLLRTTLKQLNALSDATRNSRASGTSERAERDSFSVDDVMSPRSQEQSVYSTLSLFSTHDDRVATDSEMAPRLSTVTTNTQATQATQASAVSQKPGAVGAAFQMKALTKAVRMGGRIVPAGAQMESIRYVPPGTLLEDAMVESPEEFLYRLSRSRFGKGGVLRDAHGVLVLEFQRPDDPLDVQMELAELILSRDEVPDEKPDGGVDAPPSGLRTRQKVEWARALYTERAKALVWDVGDFVLPLDLRFTWQVPSLQLHVSPKPDWGCMQQVLVLSRGGQQWILQAQEVNHHLGLAGEVSVKRRRQQALRNSEQPKAEVQESFEMIDESDDDVDLEDEDEMDLQVMTTVRTGKSSGSRGHFASRSAWRSRDGGVVFVHDFSCFGGTLELVGKPQDIKAVEKGELLGQQVLWHPPQRKPRPSSVQRLPGQEEQGDGTCSTMSAEPVDQPMRGWFDGHRLYWEPTPRALSGGVDDFTKEVQALQETVGIPKDGELPAGPWVRITSALEPGGIPGPDSGLWSLQSSFYAECYGPLPLEFLEKLGEFQAGPGARELYLRTRRDASKGKGKEAEKEPPAPEEENVFASDESSGEDYTLEALGLVETKQSIVAFEDILPTLKRTSQPPRLRTVDS